MIDAELFKKAFEDAKLFNNQVREGKTEGLVYAPAIEDKEELVVDDPDKNKTADEEGKDEGDADEQ